MEEKFNQAIGVFDSGVGGISVLQELVRILPKEKIFYCADSKNVPWSEKSEEFLLKRIFKIINFLLSKKVKMIIIASNTATSMALEKARKEKQIPVQGVIESAIDRVIRMTRNKRIGIIGTPITVKKNLHEDMIRKIDPEIMIFKRACNKYLIEYVEDGFQGDSDKISSEISNCVGEMVIKNNIDTLILGCTHYSFLRKQIKVEVGENVKILDPAEATVLDCKDILDKTKTMNTEEKQTDDKKYIFYNSSNLESFQEIIKKLTGIKEEEFDFLKLEI